jgi:glycosyltransferase involved in cell wall biosynthesis
MKLLAASGPAAHLWLHGSNLDLQHSEYQQEFNRLVGETRDRVTLAGPYQHADLPGLMASVDWVVVPSIWWENSPLVIQEAFFHGRPVICSDIGGMAEKVTDGVNGLHFRARDAVALAETIERAVATNELWEKLRKGIPNVHRMEAHVETLGRVYKDLLRQKAAAA